MIDVKKLNKEYVSYERGDGFLEAVKSLIHRKKKVFKAVDDVSFHIGKGEIVGFLGPNGAGKSTTLKIISGIMYPDSGDVHIMGYVPWKDRKKYVRNIGAVFGQKSQLLWDLPPIDAFTFQKSVYKIPEDKYNEQLEELTSLLEIKDIMKRPTRQLSLGERMRCEFVMAMLHDPKVVFLDEPTIGLDIFAKATIRKFIRKINKDKGVNFIITSHDLEDIENLCQRVIIINKGRIVFDDSMGNMRISNKKYVTVTFHSPVKQKDFKGAKLISDYIVRMEIDTSKNSVDKIIKGLSKGKKIVDLEIRDPPIKEIIERLYS